MITATGAVSERRRTSSSWISRRARCSAGWITRHDWRSSCDGRTTMTLLREALTRGESYERELLQAIEARLRSPEDYARYQMLLAEPLVRRMRPYLPEGQVRILEVGCGTGGISVYLASQGYRVSAVDREQYDPEALRATRDYSRAQGIA